MFFKKSVIAVILVLVTTLILSFGVYLIITGNDQNNGNEEGVTNINYTAEWQSEKGTLLNNQESGVVPIYIDYEMTSDDEYKSYLYGSPAYTDNKTPSDDEINLINEDLVGIIDERTSKNEVFYSSDRIKRINVLFHRIAKDGLYYSVLQIEYRDNVNLGDTFHAHKFEKLNDYFKYIDYEHMFGGV